MKEKFKNIKVKTFLSLSFAASMSVEQELGIKLRKVIAEKHSRVAKNNIYMREGFNAGILMNNANLKLLKRFNFF